MRKPLPISDAACTLPLRPASSPNRALRDMARAAVEAVTPSIATLLTLPSVSGLGVLHLVVMDAGCTERNPTRPPQLLHEHSIGPRERWDVDYAAYALRKAWLSWRHRMDSRQVRFWEPERSQPDGDANAGAVWLDGLIVAASGAFPHWDECFSLMVAAQLRARASETGQMPEQLAPRRPVLARLALGAGA